MEWCLFSPFDRSQILPVGGSLLVPCFLPRPPVVMITHASGYCLVCPGWAVSVSGSPNVRTMHVLINLCLFFFIHLFLASLIYRAAARESKRVGRKIPFSSLPPAAALALASFPLGLQIWLL